MHCVRAGMPTFVHLLYRASLHTRLHNDDDDDDDDDDDADDEDDDDDDDDDNGDDRSNLTTYHIIPHHLCRV